MTIPASWPLSPDRVPSRPAADRATRSGALDSRPWPTDERSSSTGPAGAGAHSFARVVHGSPAIQRQDEDEHGGGHGGGGHGFLGGLFQGIRNFPRRLVQGGHQGLRLAGVGGGEDQQNAVEENRQVAHGVANVVPQVVHHGGEIHDQFQQLPEPVQQEVQDHAANVGGQVAGGFAAGQAAQHGVRRMFHHVMRRPMPWQARLLMAGGFFGANVLAGAHQANQGRRRILDQHPEAAPFDAAVFGGNPPGPRDREND